MRTDIGFIYPPEEGVDGEFIGSVLECIAGGAVTRVVRADSGPDLSVGRALLVRQWLAESQSEYLFMVDADMVFSTDTMLRLAQYDHDVIGCLAFSYGDGLATPAIFLANEHGFIPHYYYPRDTLTKVNGIGAACVRVHRRVFEAIGDDWFTNRCTRIHEAGFDIWCDTSIVVGHRKLITVTDKHYKPVNTFAVIPTKTEFDNPGLQLLRDQLAAQLRNGAEDLLVIPNYPNEDFNLSAKWNHGLAWASNRAAGEPYNVAILNDDVCVGPGFMRGLADALRSSEANWLSYPNHHGFGTEAKYFQTTGSGETGRSLCGWAFMVRGESGLRFDEQFRWWYGDDDIQQQIEAAGQRVVCARDVHVVHYRPGESSAAPLLSLVANEDRQRFFSKWPTAS